MIDPLFDGALVEYAKAIEEARRHLERTPSIVSRAEDRLTLAPDVAFAPQDLRYPVPALDPMRRAARARLQGRIEPTTSSPVSVGFATTISPEAG